jgi:hypothetical protein
MSEKRIQRRQSDLESPRGDRSATPIHKRSQSIARRGIQTQSPAKSGVPATIMTRRCTPVVFVDQQRGFETRMEARCSKTYARFPVQPFTVKSLLDQEVLMAMASDLLKVEEDALPQAVLEKRN